MRRHSDDRKVLIVTAHADDEALGMGGTISKLAGQGCEILLLAMAVNASPRLAAELGFADSAEYCRFKDRSIRRAVKVLGIADYRIHRYPATELSTANHKELLNHITAEIRRFRPATLYTHYRGDINEDHRVLNKIVMTAVRPKVGMPVTKLLAFEVPNSTGWNGPYVDTNPNPSYFEIIDRRQLNRKMRAFQCYQSEWEDPPSLHSTLGIETLARFRGMSVGYEYAEAFELIRLIAPVAG